MGILNGHQQIAENFCINLIKTNENSHFQKVTQKGFANKKAFWNECN